MIVEIIVAATGVAAPSVSSTPRVVWAAPAAVAWRLPGRRPRFSKKPPVPSIPWPPNQPKSFWVPWPMNSGPTTARINSAPSLMVYSRGSRAFLVRVPVWLHSKQNPARCSSWPGRDMGNSQIVPLRPTIERLLELSDDELKGPRAAELEDAVQRGWTAVHVGELWITQVTRALADAGDDP